MLMLTRSLCVRTIVWADFFTPSPLRFMHFLHLITVDFPDINYSLMPSAVLCLMTFCASAILCVCRFVFCIFVRLPFCKCIENLSLMEPYSSWRKIRGRKRRLCLKEKNNAQELRQY
jgi:hypothetical protein